MSRSAEAVLQDNSFHCFSKSEARAIIAVLKREGFLAADKERRQDGKYDFSDANAICKCGVRLGDHIAEYPHENEATNCQKFQPDTGVREALERIINVPIGYQAASQMEAIARKALAAHPAPPDTVREDK